MTWEKVAGRPWISGSATAAVRTLREDQASLPAHSQLEFHLDVEISPSAEENVFDVLRDIFPKREDAKFNACGSKIQSLEPISSFQKFSEKFLFAGIHFESCIYAKNFIQGMLFHHYFVSSHLDDDLEVLHSLARLYVKCDLLSDAFFCFSNMDDQSQSIWRYMIALRSEQEENEDKIFQIFSNSLFCNSLPDIHILLVLLSSCKDINALTKGKQLHVLLKSSASMFDVAIGTALLSMYSRCGDFQEAKIVFDHVMQRNIVSWNAMIAACIQHETEKEAIQLFSDIQQQGFLPNVVTFVSTTSACAKLLDMTTGMSVHVQASNRGLESNVLLTTALVSMYGRCGSMENAYIAFQEVNVPCVILWTGMLKVCCQQGHSKEVFYMYQQMQEIGVLPNDVTYLCMLSASNCRDLLEAGRRVHAQALGSGAEWNTVMSTALAVMYGRCGSIEESNQIFDSLAEKSNVTWNAMILMHVDNCQSEQGIQLYRDMQQQGVSPDKFTFVNVIHACRVSMSSVEGKIVHQCILETNLSEDIVVCNALIEMYSKCKQMAVSEIVFYRMQIRNTVSWNTLMAIYDQNGHYEKAWNLFGQMQADKICPDEITYACALSALAYRGFGLDCWRVHMDIVYKGFDLDLAVVRNVIIMYGKNGSVNSARLLFDRVNQRDGKAWDALMRICRQFESTHALQLLDEMKNQGLVPSREKLVGCISTFSCSFGLARLRQLHIAIQYSCDELYDSESCALICSYAECGDLEEAWELFNISERNLTVCNCIIGAFARHGRGYQVGKLFEDMEQAGILPDSVTFSSVLSACNHSGLVEGAFAYLTLMTYQKLPFAVSHYDSVMDILGRVGRLHEAMHLVRMMPFEPTEVTWTSLLVASKNLADLQHGVFAATHLLEISCDCFVPYIFLSRMYLDF